MKAKTQRHIIIWIIVVLIYAWLRKNDPTEIIRLRADIWFMQFVVAYFLIMFAIDLGKYHTTQFVGDNIHGSCAFISEPVGLWSIFHLGDIEAFELKVKGNDATVIIPTDAVFKAGDNVYTPIKLRKKELKEVPHECYNIIERENLNQENIYIGYATAQQETNDPDLILAQRVKEQLERKVNTYEDMLKGKWNLDESALDHLGRLKKSVDGKEGIMEKLTSWRKKSVEEDNNK